MIIMSSTLWSHACSIVSAVLCRGYLHSLIFYHRKFQFEVFSTATMLTMSSYSSHCAHVTLSWKKTSLISWHISLSGCHCTT